MKKISVLFLFTFVFGCGIQAKTLVDGMKNEREMQQDEIPSQEPLFDNSRFPMGYGESNGYSKVVPLYDSSNYRTEVMKRSLRDHNPTQRQTGIIYGGGKPIGILQPYQESFKFMPIKEEHVYSLEGGRSSMEQQEPYVNLMYPLARFARSEDAIRMAEMEAAKAEFLDKHYPSMLVDFKIHNKLHPTGYNAKSAPTFNIKREENNNQNNIELTKKKRENQTPSASTQKLHKRESQHVQKRESDTRQQSEVPAAVQKRESKVEKVEKVVEKREEKKAPTTQKRQAVSAPSVTEKKKKKKKRQSKLTDAQFENLKKSLAKRTSNGHIQVIEEDLKGLLSDMGLIEDDLEENAEEMEESKSGVVQDEDLEEGFDTTVQKDKEEPQVEHKRDSTVAPDRKKRADETNNAPTNIPLIETRNSDSKKRTLSDVQNKRSVSESPDNGKRFIEVSFSTKDNKEPVRNTANEGDNTCPKPSVIPNKREVPNAPLVSNKQERSIPTENKVEKKRSMEPVAPTTESYEQYEKRVAREIKNKIKLLKEEVKRELGALESDKDESDDDESFGETQRKKRFIMNTLMDEESQNIDPNENLENSELEPHVRRRRTLSTDMMSYGSQKSSMNSFDKDLNLMNFDPMSVVGQSKFDFDVDGFYGESDGRSQSFTNTGSYAKNDVTKKDIPHSKARTRKANDYSSYMSDNTGSRSYRWDDPSLFMKNQGKMYLPEYQRRVGSKYTAPNSRRNLRNDMNSESGNFNSDYENDAANSNSEEEGEVNMNTVADMTRQATERKTEVREPSEAKTNANANANANVNANANTNAKVSANNANEEHSPKKLQGYNQKYFYYYMGGNDNERKDNVAPSASNSQRSAPVYNNNYKRLSGQYPSQYYNSMSRLQNNQYTKSSSDHALTNKRAFQRRYDKPFGRRRKRHANLMVPLKDEEDAIVSNVAYTNSSMPYYHNFMIKAHARNGNSMFPFRTKTMRGVMEKNLPNAHPTGQNMTADGAWSKIKKASGGQLSTEKGKNISTNAHDSSGGNALVPWNLLMKKYESSISDNEPQHIDDTMINIEESDSKNVNSSDYTHNSLLEKSHQLWHGNDYMNSFPNTDFNSYSISQIEQNRIGNNPSAEKSDEDPNQQSYSGEKKINGRKILSWQENTNFTEINQEKFNNVPYSNVIQSRENVRTNLSGNPKYNNVMNEMNDFQGDAEADEYEEIYYAEPISTSTLTNVARPVKSTPKPVTRRPVTSTIHPAEILKKVQATKEIVHGNNTEKHEMIRSTESNVVVRSIETYSLSDLVVNKHNLFVQNESLPWADWKRRKRDVQPEYQETARRKRSWFWPTLSFLHNTAPQIDEDLEFDQNESPIERQGSKRSSDKSAFSLEDDTEAEDEGDFDDDPMGYERKKRDTVSRPFYPVDRSVYYYTNMANRNSYLPVSRNRRYVQGQFREPQQQLLTEMSDAELFGALPQGYAGELTRYKRVKRADKGPDNT